MTAMHFESLAAISRSIRDRRLSPVEVTRHLLDRVAATDPWYHAFVTVVAERALEQATVAQDELSRGRWRGPLHGVPIAVKDIFHTTYAPTTAGMPILAEFIADANATVVERLERAGAVMLGKLQTCEGVFAYHHPDVVPPVNPWHADYWPGSSSSGPGVATAAGLCYGSLASDTGGSIREPAMVNGVTGLKPTWGRASRYGAFAFAPSLDHVGTMARTAEDAAIMLGAIAGWDSLDPTSLRDPVPDYAAACRSDMRGVRVGLDTDYAYGVSDPEVVEAVEQARLVLMNLGARIRTVEIGHIEDTIRTWRTLVQLEASVVHEATYPSRRAEYGPSLASLLDQGRATASRDIAVDLLQRHIFTLHLADVFREVDVLLIPAMATPAATVTERADATHMEDIMKRNVRFTAPFNLSGSPTITVPCGFDSVGLPLAMQLVGPHLSEGELCRIAATFQRATDWHTRHPADPVGANRLPAPLPG